MNRLLPLSIALSFSAWIASADSGLSTQPESTIRSLEDLTIELNEQASPALKNRHVPQRKHDSKRVAKGSTLYQMHCSRCHGRNAEGTENWHLRDPYGSFPPPPLYGSAHTWHHPEAQLVTIVQTGSGGMPSFREQLDPSEVGDIII